MRWARSADGPVLVAIDDTTWTPASSPAPAPTGPRPFFRDGTGPQDVLVAELDGVVVGYAALGNTIPLDSHAHVLEVRGVAVDPAAGGRGVGARLVRAAVAAARDRGARRLTLRVLGPNTVARRLYLSCGFEEEGVLRGEFLLDGRYVDDILMVHRLGH